MTDEHSKGGITEEYLMTVGSEAEMGIVEGILRYEKIPFVKRHLNAGDYSRIILGFSNMGVKIYVSSEDLQRARDALQFREEPADI